MLRFGAQIAKISNRRKYPLYGNSDYNVRFKIKENIEKSMELYLKYNESNISQYSNKKIALYGNTFSCTVSWHP